MNKYKQFIVYIVSFLLAFPQVTLAQSGAQAGAKSGASTVQINQTSQETSPQQRGAGTSSSPEASSVNSAAGKSKDRNVVAGVVSGTVGLAMLALGGWFMFMAATCGAPGCQPPNLATGAVFLGMGAMAVNQSATNLTTSKKSGGTAAQTSAASTPSWGNGVENIGSDLLANADVKAIVDVDKAKEGLAAAKKFGFDGKSPIKINGKEFKASDFSSAESMIAAGLPKDLVEKAMATVAKLEKDATKKLAARMPVGGFAEDSGGGAASASIAGAKGFDANTGASIGGAPRPLARDPASVNIAGLTKNFNGESIGVAADSIFSMMTRRYKLKEKQNSFIEEAQVNLHK